MTDYSVLCEGLAFPEGPVFGASGDLWCVEADAGQLCRVSDGERRRYRVGGTPNGLAVDADGALWVTDASRDEVRRFDPDRGDAETVADSVAGEGLDAPNDLAFDGVGNLLFTCPGTPDDDPTAPTGEVCCLRPDGTVTTVGRDLVFPNGLTFTDGGDRLLVAETYAGRLSVADWDDETCEWGDPDPWADVGGSVGPDGLALDAAGHVYAAVYGSGIVARADPAGTVVDTYEVPGATPTNVTFDPTGGRGLVVTVGEEGRLVSLPALGPGSRDVPFVPSL